MTYAIACGCRTMAVLLAQLKYMFTSSGMKRLHADSIARAEGFVVRPRVAQSTNRNNTTPTSPQRPLWFGSGSLIIGPR